jgi:carbamate kinase
MTATPPLPPIVVALGGNALSPAGSRDTIERQFDQAARTAAVLVDLVTTGAPLILTHGNGPQVGSAMIRNEIASEHVYELPLDIIVADIQGGMGYMIAQSVSNELRRRGDPRRLTAIVTTVEVDPDDPSFDKPTKPIGPYYDADRAARRRDIGWDLVEIPGQGWRRVVSSPRPRRIVEIDLIRRLVRDGELLVAGGGGGVAVAVDADGLHSGREAVVDKDLVSGLLASEIDAGLFLNVTSVPRVCLDFGTPDERTVDRLSVGEARRHLDDGQFPPGSMGPKIRAAIDFLERSGRADARVIISDIEGVPEALSGGAGTTITR